MECVDFSELLASAKLARARAYAPYSKFQVGAALQAASGRVYIGCNVENASYGATCCAERTAMFSAIADGVKPFEFAALAVVADTEDVISPCGICRQVLAECCPPEMPIMLANLSGASKLVELAQLLPDMFGPGLLFSRGTEE